MKQRTRLRAALGAATVAMLAVAMLAPVGAAAAGNGNGNGQANGHGQGQGNGNGHGQANRHGHGQGNGNGHGQANRHGHGQGNGNGHGQGNGQANGHGQGNGQANGHGHGQTGGDGTTDESTGQASVDTAPASAGQAKGGLKHAAMQACKKGGWQGLQRADGTRFTNQGRCVSYAVHGGVLVPVVPAVTISFAVSPVDGISCDATATLADFDPTTAYVGTLLVDTVAAPPVPITTDVLGDAAVPLAPLAPLSTFTVGQTLDLTVNGVTSGDVIVACAVVPVVPLVPFV